MLDKFHVSKYKRRFFLHKQDKNCSKKNNVLIKLNRYLLKQTICSRHFELQKKKKIKEHLTD
jgi:hypothetical protein